MTINQLSIFVENKPGKIAKITDHIAKAGIDIRALSVADTQDFGILRLIVNDTKKAVAALKEKNYIVSSTEIVAVCLPDQPGSLANLLGTLKENDINLEYMYAFFTRKRDHAYMALRVSDIEKTTKVLVENGYPAVSAEELDLI